MPVPSPTAGKTTIYGVVGLTDGTFPSGTVFSRPEQPYLANNGVYRPIIAGFPASAIAVDGYWVLTFPVVTTPHPLWIITTPTAQWLVAVPSDEGVYDLHALKLSGAAQEL